MIESIERGKGCGQLKQPALDRDTTFGVYPLTPYVLSHYFHFINNRNLHREEDILNFNRLQSFSGFDRYRKEISQNLIPLMKPLDCRVRRQMAVMAEQESLHSVA
jgi:hypothetical protein